MAALVAQDQANGIRTILHVGGCQKARLPDILGREIAQRLHQPERKQRDHGDDGFVCPDAENRVARPYNAGTQQRSRHRQKRGVRRDELVLARQTDDFIDSRLVFAFSLDLFQQRIDAGSGPQTRQLRVIEGFFRQIGLCPPSAAPHRHAFREP